MHVIVGNGLNCPTESGNPVFDPLIVDYVRIYKPVGYTPIGANQNAENYYNQQMALYNITPYKSTSDWVINSITSIQSYSVLSSMKGCQGGGKYYYKGNDNYVWSTYWTSTNGGQFVSAKLPENLLALSGNVSLSQNGDVVFFSRSTLSSSSLSYLQNGTIHNINSVINDAFLNYIVSSNNGLSIYYLNNTGKIIKYSRSSLTSHIWTKQESSYYAALNSKIIISEINESVIFYKSSSNNITSLNFVTGVRTAITNTGDVASNIAISSDEKIIYYKDNQNRLRICTKPNPQIQPPPIWSNSIFYIRGGSPPFYYNTALTNVKDGLCTALDNTSKQLYFHGTDNRPWYVYWDGQHYIANSFDWNQPNVKGDFQIIKLGTSNNETNIAYTDVYNKIRLIRWQSPCERLNLPCGNVTIMSAKIPLEKHLKENPMNFVDSTLIYPNPATNSINIENKNSSIAGYIVLNLQGKKLEEVKFIGSVNAISISVAHLITGLYILELKFKDGYNRTYKFNKI